ncbi:MerR family transcriptional regulator [Actinomadura macrotermitis]|uniref:HTH merR-type domain-containing protein n=1 Tax=Actinomadura macrotermitis TaxID=2585200 RepID=A0A7K0C3H8_9ACTN|nr:MerR family transcriptional regulator [Actinomadura macrotermitis]MQY07995.1 hypothetical protein [Actinomadura macrotermitis]
MSSGGAGPVEGGAWTAGQVARYLGIAESTLRSWHLRYDIGPPNPVPGRYRRYGAADVARLRRMRDLVRAGMLPSEAARAVSGAPRQGRPAERALAGLLDAARALDTGRCAALVEDALARWGVVAAWEGLCRPALVAVDADQRDEPDCVDIEHALSWAVAAALHRLPRPPAASGAAPVLLACTDGEQHTLALEALAAALAEREVPVRMLGAATPAAGLLRAVAAVRPAAVVLWSQRPATARPATLLALADHPVLRITAGPGWASPRPAGVRHAAGLAEALALTSPGPPG